MVDTVDDLKTRSWMVDKKDIIKTKLLLCVEAYLDNNIVLKVKTEDLLQGILKNKKLIFE